MTWYSLSKHSGLENFWWDRFYEHFSKNAEFSFSENGMQLIPTPVGRIFYSGVDGRKVFFAFTVLYKNKKYNCGINMEFDFQYGLPSGILGWQNSNLVEMKTKYHNINMIQGSWYVVVVENEDHSVVDRGFFLPQKGTPNSIITNMKNSILKDGNDNEDNGDNPGVEPSNSPNARKIPSLPKMPKKQKTDFGVLRGQR